MYVRQLPDDVAFDRDAFHVAVWCVLARYAALQGHGYQAALPNAGFDVLVRASSTVDPLELTRIET
jgi:hypothetical protein